MADVRSLAAVLRRCSGAVLLPDAARDRGRDDFFGTATRKECTVERRPTSPITLAISGLREHGFSRATADRAVARHELLLNPPPDNRLNEAISTLAEGVAAKVLEGHKRQLLKVLSTLELRTEYQRLLTALFDDKAAAA